MNGKLKIGWNLLWSNPESASEFAPQTLSLDLTKNKFVILYFCSYLNNNDQWPTNPVFIQPTTSEFDATMVRDWTRSQTNASRMVRHVSITPTGITFGQGSYKTTGSGNTTQTITNKAMVPLQIWAD